MARYEYQGRSNKGDSIKGEMEASSKDAVVNMLIQRDVIPVRINELSAASTIKHDLSVLLGSQKVDKKVLTMFCRQMYTVYKSGLPLTRGLRGLSASISHEYFKFVLVDIAERLEAGSSLARALRHYPKVFDDLFISMVEVGESNGNLDIIFKQVAYYLERDEVTLKRVKQATRYPLFVSIAIVLAIISVNIWVIPAFSGMFKRFGSDLPIVTQFLIGMSNFFVNYWFYIFIAGTGGGIWFFRFIKTEHGKIIWSQKLLRMPVAGNIINQACMARYARSMSLMLRTGVPINQSLLLCAATIDNAFISKKINDIHSGIERGESMLKTHVQAKLFTPLVLQMISIGEESGQVESLLNDVADFYEREVDYDLKTLTDKIEPILIIVMAAFVAILAIGIFLPMWGMYDIQK